MNKIKFLLSFIIFPLLLYSSGGKSWADARKIPYDPKEELKET